MLKYATGRLVITSVIALVGAITYAQPAFPQRASLSFDKAIAYCRNMDANTRLQNQSAEAQIINQPFEGNITISDVWGTPHQLIQLYTEFPQEHIRFEFLVSNPQLVETAANLRKGEKIHISAKLSHFSTEQIYINRPKICVAEFGGAGDQSASFDILAK
jgi:hypothetical protein